MENETVGRGRIRWLQVFSVLGGLLVFSQLVRWQVMEWDELARLAAEQHQRDAQVLPERGNIYDASGNLIAGVIFLDRVEAAPNVLAANPRSLISTANELAPLLGKSPEELVTMLNKPSQRYAVVARKVPPPVSERILSLIRTGRLTAVGLSPSPQRVYPQGKLAAHVLGFYSEAGEFGQGQYGVEGQYEEVLRGRPGRKLTTRAPLATDAVPVAQTLLPAQPGVDLVLTIDQSVQYLVERELEKAIEKYQAESGTVIVMDPKTGAILAMASRPTFDPNNYQAYFNPKLDTFANPAISMVYEPGSTFKVITMAAALDAGVVTPNTWFNDTPSVHYGGTQIYNWNKQGYGRSNMLDLLARSSNVGAVFVADLLGKDRFYSYVRAFGFGAPTGIDLWGEVGGLVPDPASRNWYPSSLATNAFGQGIAVTPLQLVTAVAAVANGGVLMRPYVVKEVHTAKGVERIAPVPVRRVIRQETARTLTAMLHDSGKRSETKLHLVPGYNLAGKTGTASIPLPGGGYDEKWTIASYVGYGPIEDPRFVILVKLDYPAVEPWGSLVAAPVFAAIAEQLLEYYQIPPSNPAEFQEARSR